MYKFVSLPRGGLSILVAVSFFLVGLSAVAADFPPPPAKPTKNQSIQAAVEKQPAASNAREAVMLPQPGLPNPMEVVTEENPFSPEDIRNIRTLLEGVKREASQPPVPPARPSSSVVTVDLSPGALPILVRTTLGQGAAISFIDATGAPWPIDAPPHNFSPKDFDIKGMPGEGAGLGSVITVSPLSSYRTGSFSVLLKGLSSPLAFTLMAGQPVVDSRIDVRIPKAGPNAQPVVSADRRPALSPDLVGFLNGGPPATAKSLKTDNNGTHAWEYNGEVVVRSADLLIAPAYRDMSRSADGMAVYVVPETPVLTLSRGGEIYRVRISKYE